MVQLWHRPLVVSDKLSEFPGKRDGNFHSLRLNLIATNREILFLQFRQLCVTMNWSKVLDRIVCQNLLVYDALVLRKLDKQAEYNCIGCRDNKKNEGQSQDTGMVQDLHSVARFLD